MNQRVALITGASQGLGRALAEVLADHGWTLVIDARRADRLDEPRPPSWPSRTNSRRDRRRRRRSRRTATSWSAAVGKFGRLDLLVNNASTLGASPLPPLDAIDLDVLRHTYEVNVVAPLALMQQLLPALVAPRTARSSTSPPTPRSRPTKAGAATDRRRPRSSSCPRCSRPSIPSCVCWWSIPATCAPRCTRTRSPATTSPIARRPRPLLPVWSR